MPGACIDGIVSIAPGVGDGISGKDEKLASQIAAVKILRMLQAASRCQSDEGLHIAPHKYFLE